jgi:glycosyltransferase involved in cell wall biosynthesis
MHLAICSDGIFPESIGGMERHTRLLAETIARRRPDVRITVIHTHPGKTMFAGIPNIDEATVLPKPGRRPYLLECLELSERFAQVLRNLPDAIVYSQGICVVRHIREFADRLVVNPHGLESFQTLTLRDWAKAAPFRLVQRHTFRHARHVISLGGRLTDILSRECGSPGKVVVLPNGVVMPPRSERFPSPEGSPIRLLFVGRLAPNKGVPDLLAALEELDRRGHCARFEADIVGGGPLLEALRGANVRTNVRFLGKVSDERLDELYARADVLVLPTLFEGMPTVVLEAMARGLPVLVTDVGATRELVDDLNGEIIPKRDPAALADALLRLRALGADGRRAMGARGLARVNERFTWLGVADGHLKLFDSLRRR